MPRGLVVSIVGAARTGKTVLAQELDEALREQGLSVTVVVVDSPALSPAGASPRSRPRGARPQGSLTLLTASGPTQPSEPDAQLRAELQRVAVPYSVVSGDAPERLASALRAVRHALQSVSREDEVRSNPRWQWVCERCGDVECERHLLPRLPSA